MARESYASDYHNIPRFGGHAFTPTLDQNYQVDDGTDLFKNGFTVMTLSDGGTVVVTTISGVQRTYANVPAYFVLPVRVRSVDTGTTATVEGLI